MKTYRDNSKRESLIASTLLATAFVVTAARSRAQSGRTYQVTHAVDDRAKIDNVRSAPIHRTRFIHKFIAAIDHRFAGYFHCAIPNGLEPRDFELSDLAH